MPMTKDQAIQIVNGLRHREGIVRMDGLPFNVMPEDVQRAFRMLFWDEGAEYASRKMTFAPFILADGLQTDRVFPAGKACGDFRIIALALTAWAMKEKQLFADDWVFSGIVEEAVLAEAHRKEAQEALPTMFFGSSSSFLPLLDMMVRAGMLSDELVGEFEDVASQIPHKVIGLVQSAVETAVRCSSELKAGALVGIVMMTSSHGCGDPEYPNCSPREGTD